MNPNELKWKHVYLYVRYPYQCKVQFIAEKTINNIWHFKFKIVEQVKCFIDTDKVMCNAFNLDSDSVNTQIYELEEIITSIKDIQ